MKLNVKEQVICNVFIEIMFDNKGLSSSPTLMIVTVTIEWS